MKDALIESLLEECRVIAKRSKCKRRKFGAIITNKNGVHLSNGYNGSVRGAFNCGTEVPCGKDLMKEAPYTSYVSCAGVHAEVNAILNAARTGTAIKDAVIFLNSSEDGRCELPCRNCRRTIINAGISLIYWKNKNNNTSYMKVKAWIPEENSWMLMRGKE